MQVGYGESGYEWELSIEQLNIIRRTFAFLPDEFPDDVFADYVGATKAEAASISEDIHQQGNVVVLPDQAEAVVRMHLRLMAERLSAESFGTWVGASKAVVLDLERTLDFQGYSAKRERARAEALETGELKAQVAQAVTTYGGEELGRTMSGLQQTSIARCHAIEFGPTSQDVILRAVGEALLGIVESRANPRTQRSGGARAQRLYPVPEGESTRDWLMGIVDDGPVDLGFVIAEYYAATLPRSRSQLRTLLTRTSRPGLLRAIQAVLYSCEKGDARATSE